MTDLKQEESKLQKRISTSFFDDNDNIRQSVVAGQHKVEDTDLIELEKQ